MRVGDSFQELKLTAGFFDVVESTEQSLYLSGWMLLPQLEMDSIEVYWNHNPVGPAKKVDRPDVLAVMPWVDHAGSSGFCVRFEIPPGESGRIDLIGLHRDKPVGRMSLRWLGPDTMQQTLPPAKLTQRVSGLEGAPFRVRALKTFTDVFDARERHAQPSSSGLRILDWGCGCGALSSLLLRHLPKAQVSGCDIDGEAVRWCQENLPTGDFQTIAEKPPTPFEEGSFDLIVGSSVMTHLSRADQRAWLQEIRRLLAPNGLLLASTHGAYALERAMRQQASSLKNRLRQMQVRWQTRLALKMSGIYDRLPDRILDGVASPGYYRAVYQTRDYTIREWSKSLEFVDYIERGLVGHQDLVVMRRGTSPGYSAQDFQ